MPTPPLLQKEIPKTQTFIKIAWRDRLRIIQVERSARSIEALVEAALEKTYGPLVPSRPPADTEPADAR